MSRLYLWYYEKFQWAFIYSSSLNFLLHKGQMYIIEFCIFIYRYNCLACNYACLLLFCQLVIYLLTGAFLFNYCSLFYLSCSIVIRGLCFYSQIYFSRCFLQQFSVGQLFFFFYGLLYFLSNAGRVNSSQALVFEYMTVTFSPRILKLGQLVVFKTEAASPSEQNQTNAKSLNPPVALFFIILISLIGAIFSNIQRRYSSSIYIMILPRIIRLQLLIASSFSVFTFVAYIQACELQFSLQFAFFQLSHRQHFILLAKFLQSHLSQYQSYVMARSIFFTGKQQTLNFFPFIGSQPLNFSEMYQNILLETQILGYLAYALFQLKFIQSGTDVPTVMLMSNNIFQTYAYY